MRHRHLNDMEEIVHKGKIVEIDPQFTTVEIISESACASCHASGLCGISEYKTKAIQVPTSAAALYEVGDEVEVVLKATMGHKAVWIAYVIPLILLLVFIFIPLGLGKSELLSALCGIFAVASYYWFIYAFRNILRNEYVFKIRK